MRNKPTSELEELLENTDPKHLGEYLHENRAYLADDAKPFYHYFTDIPTLKSL